MSTRISTDYHHIPSETHDLYSVYIGNHKINTIVTACPLEITEWLSQFESSTNLLIGLDIEWRPNIFRNQDNPAATLQLCVAHACLIVQLLYCPTLPQQLFDFFAKKEFTFFGVGIDHDADKLFDDYGLLVGGKVVDLATLASQKYADKSLNNAGLKELARIVLGMEIQKPKSISCSNWDQDWLNPGQVHYACVDAFLSYQIGKFLNSSESTMSDRLSSLERILNKSTPDKFDLLKAHLCDSWITTADILRDVVDLIFEKAITEPPFGAMYAQLCYDVNENLPSFPYDEPGGKKISFEYVFVSNCQRVFETSDELWKEVKQMTDLEQDAERRVKQSLVELRTLGNVRLIGELLKMNIITTLLGHVIIKKLLENDDNESCPPEGNVEALCNFLNVIGNDLEASQWSKDKMDIYFSRLEELSTSYELAPRLRFMVQDVINFRTMRVCRRQDLVYYVVKSHNPY